MNRKLLACLVFSVATLSNAVTTNVQKGGNLAPNVSAEATRPSASKALSDDSSGLRRGTIERVDVANGTFGVFGQMLSFDPKKVRIFGKDGKPTSVYALRQGATIRFTLDPADTSRRRVAVVYVD